MLTAVLATVQTPCGCFTGSSGAWPTRASLQRGSGSPPVMLSGFPALIRGDRKEHDDANFRTI
jgi:hypothetical protein